MRAKARYVAVLLAGLTVLGAGKASAQDFSGPLSPGAFEATMNMGPIAETLRRQMQRKDSRNPPPAATEAARPLRPESFRYVPSKSRRAANLASFVARSRAVDPKGADDLAKLVASRDLIEEMRAPLAKYGLRIDNLADAYTVWWIGAWQATRGSTDEPSQAATTAVKQQVMRTIASVPEFANANDSLRQSMSEALLMQALLLAAGLEQAKGNAAQTRAIGRAANEGARGMGLDLAAMTLTEEGFKPVN
jgi:hypothetical protein